ncbi:SIMPL domain-containing protein [Idiomarina sp. M1R2S28]|uniref:SIMPL domain-containing protein n=1 Tax=Idiomarina rhizosphaerae TaxID=2961572 RepID=A0A9X2FUQ9_9GAMM|nr:SIMPL domain-containing protein [Idiomarina rhizosphaerae]MCP1338972.1 SIMPL domain-containing protein [Idiomarina rhizosphaerae]
MKNFLLLFLIISFSSWGSVIPTSPHIYVEGYAEKKIQPEIIVISTYVEHHDLNASLAKSEVDKKSVVLIQTAKDIGIEREDIKTTPLQISPHFEYEDGEKIDKGTSVSRNIDITLRDISLYHQLNQTLVDSGISGKLNAEVKVKNPRKVKKEVLYKALEDAREKAEQLASLNGKKVKDVHSISEFKTREENSYTLIPSQHIYGQSSNYASVQKRYRVPPPTPGEIFEIGEMTASATIYVVFTIE